MIINNFTFLLVCDPVLRSRQVSDVRVPRAVNDPVGQDGSPARLGLHDDSLDLNLICGQSGQGTKCSLSVGKFLSSWDFERDFEMNFGRDEYHLDGVILHDDVHGEAVQQRPDATGGDQVVSHNLQQPIRVTGI